jgi:aspartate 1-decarboxylase
MQLTMLKSKLHRAVVTEANLDYVGSITIDQNLMEAANLLEYEKVQVADINNGARFETYVIKGKRNGGQVCLNGAAAHCANIGDKIIIMAYAQMDAREAAGFKPAVVILNGGNKIIAVKSFEKHGQIIKK